MLATTPGFTKIKTHCIVCGLLQITCSEGKSEHQLKPHSHRPIQYTPTFNVNGTTASGTGTFNCECVVLSRPIGWVLTQRLAVTKGNL